MGILSRLGGLHSSGSSRRRPAAWGPSLQPVSLEKRIERAMDTNKSFRDDGVHRAEPVRRST